MGETLNALLEAEAERLVGAGRYERTPLMKRRGLARMVAPKAAFVTRLRDGQLPDRPAR